jgi:hypothetical protein
MPDNVARWDDVQVDALSIVLRGISMWKKMMLQNLQDLVARRPSLFGGAGQRECIWAVSVIISRQVHGRLIPFLDQINHATNPNSEIDCDSSGCKVYALRAITGGDEVTISYGTKSNVLLLQTYGFSVLGNSVSALSLDLAGLNTTSCGGSRLLLDHEAPLGLPEERGSCLETAVGRCALLRAVLEDCEKLHQRFLPTAGGAAGRPAYGAAFGIPHTASALRALYERRPQLASDGQLASALRAEIRLAGRCAKDTREALNSMAAAGTCEAVQR